jgi:hypothetical protein
VSAKEVAERLRSRKVIAEIQTKEGALYVRGINGRERVEYFSWLGGAGSGNILLSDHRLLAIALCEEDGSPIFSDEASALEILQEWTHEDVSAAAKKVLSLSGLAKDSAEDAAKKS